MNTMVSIYVMSYHLSESQVELSPDLGEFSGLGPSSTFGEVCLWLNTYVDRNGLANGQLPLLGGEYPGPLVKFDECLAYLFKPYLADMRIKEGKPVRYSQFKALCLNHVRFIRDE